jgi:hypothetical protein
MLVAVSIWSSFSIVIIKRIIIINKNCYFDGVVIVSVSEYATRKCNRNEIPEKNEEGFCFLFIVIVKMEPTSSRFSGGIL